MMALTASIGSRTYFLSYFSGQSKSCGKPVNGVRCVMLLQVGPLELVDSQGGIFVSLFFIFSSYESFASQG